LDYLKNFLFFFKKKKKKTKANVEKYDFEIIVKNTKQNLKVINLPNSKQHRFSEFK